MASKNDNQIRNIGYETLYQSDYVKDKKVLIIGSGMGRGVQLAIRNGASHVDCVDIEPSLKVKYDLYRNYVDDIYSNKKVDFYVMDGRVALNKLSDNKYDLIVFEGVISAYAVHSLNITTEGYLCTAEAVNNALNMLEDNGIFLDYTSSSEKTINSFFSKYPQNVNEYKSHYVYAYVSDRFANNNYYVCISGLSKSSDKIEKLGAGLLELANDDMEIRDFEKHNINFAGVIDSKIITDDRPYPYIEFNNEVLFELLFSIAFILISLGICYMGHRTRKISFSYLQFVLLGMAMMMMELYVINKLNFFLNDSMMSYSIGSAIFLLAFSYGNARSVRINLSRFSFSAYFVVAVGIFFVVYNSPIINALLATNLFLRIIVAIMTIAPLAILCGTFFPRLLLNLVNNKCVSDSMGYIMLLDAFGVGAGFFLYNYVGCILGFNYTLMIIVLLYISESFICYRKGI